MTAALEGGGGAAALALAPGPGPGPGHRGDQLTQTAFLYQDWKEEVRALRLTADFYLTDRQVDRNVVIVHHCFIVLTGPSSRTNLLVTQLNERLLIIPSAYKRRHAEKLDLRRKLKRLSSERSHWTLRS